MEVVKLVQIALLVIKLRVYKIDLNEFKFTKKNLIKFDNY